MAGHVLVEAPTVKEALDQIDDTNIWNFNAPVADAAPTETER